MRDALPVLATAAIALALVAVVTFGAGDRQTLVPPPEVVAENFARDIVQERYELAVKYLSRDLRKTVNARVLRARYGAVRAQLGPPNTVQGERDWMGENDAAARATIETDRGSAFWPLTFTREHALWVVRDLPDPVLALNVRAPR